MSNYAIAGSGLEKMFYGQILCILTVIPLVGWIAGIVGIVLFLVGLHEAAGADEGYRAAFYVEIAMLVLNVLGNFIGILDILTSLLTALAVYLVCAITANLLCAKGDSATAGWGRLVWKVNAVCVAVAVVCYILSIIPGVAVLALVVLIPTAIASLVGGILYMTFLYRASRSLRY